MYRLWIAMFWMLPAVAISAPSGTDDDCFPKRSLAWCLMDLQESSDGLTDVPRDQVPSALYRPSEAKMAFDSAANATMAVLGAADTLSSLAVGNGPGIPGPMMILMALKSSKVNAEYRGGIFVIPKAEVPEGDVRRHVVETFSAAAIATLGAERAEWYQKSDRVTDRMNGFFLLTGGRCEGKECKLVLPIAGSQSQRYLKEIETPAYLDPKKPPAYRLQRWADGVAALYVDGKQVGVETYLDFSSKLPAWANLYFPPTKNPSPIPVVMNRGEVLLFIEPPANNSME